MACPKKKIPRSARGSRRAAQKLEKPAGGECPKCHEAKLPHRVCPHCGYYKDFKVLEVED